MHFPRLTDNEVWTIRNGLIIAREKYQEHIRSLNELKHEMVGEGADTRGVKSLIQQFERQIADVYAVIAKFDEE